MKANRWFMTALCLLLLFSLAFPAAAAGSSVQVQLQVHNKLTGDKPPALKDFTFLLEAKDGAPMPGNDTITISGTGSKAFPAIVYTEPGDFHYTIRLVDDGKKGYTYDKTVYQVTVQVVTDNSGKLSAFVYVYESGSTEKSTGATFLNSYKVEGSSQSPHTADPFDSTLWLGLNAGALYGLLAMCLLFLRRRSRPMGPPSGGSGME